MNNSIRSCTLRFLQGCFSIVVGFWLPQELFIFSKVESKRFEIKYLKKAIYVLILSIMATFLSMIINVYLSFQANAFLIHTNVVVPARALIFILLITQVVRYFAKLRIEIGLTCLIPIAVSLFIRDMPYGINKYDSIYAITEYELVWPLVENKFFDKLQKVARDSNEPQFVVLQNYAVNSGTNRALVYDESDEIANSNKLHLKYRLRMDEDLIEYWNGDTPAMRNNKKYKEIPLIVQAHKLIVRKLKDHFYVVFEHFYTVEFEIKINENSYEIINKACR